MPPRQALADAGSLFLPNVRSDGHDTPMTLAKKPLLKRLFKPLSRSPRPQSMKKTPPSPTNDDLPHGPVIRLDMIGNCITANNGDVIVNVQYTHGVESGLSASCSTTVAPKILKFLDQFPQIPLGEIQTNERIGGTDRYQVYAAKVNGKQAIVKEFYGEDAIKDWLDAARTHASTHLAPEVLRLMGASLQDSDLDEVFGIRRYLVFEADKVLTLSDSVRYRYVYKSHAELAIVGFTLFYDMANVSQYLSRMKGLTLNRESFESFFRLTKVGGLTTTRLLLGFNTYDSTAPSSSSLGTTRHQLHSDSEILYYIGQSLGILSAEYDLNEVSILINSLCVPAGVAAGLRQENGLGDYMFPNLPVARLRNSRGESSLYVCCIRTEELGPISNLDVLEELYARGTVTRREYERFRIQLLRESINVEIRDVGGDGLRSRITQVDSDAMEEGSDDEEYFTGEED